MFQWGMARAPAIRCRLSALLDCSGVELTVLSCGCSVWYLTFVKAVVLAHGSEPIDVNTMDESETEKMRRMGRKKNPINPPKPLILVLHLNLLYNVSIRDSLRSAKSKGLKLQC